MDIPCAYSPTVTAPDQGKSSLRSEINAPIKTNGAYPRQGTGTISSRIKNKVIYFPCPPPEPCPLDALPADEEALVPEEADAAGEETELVEVAMAPE